MTNTSGLLSAVTQLVEHQTADRRVAISVRCSSSHIAGEVTVLCP